MHCIFTGKAMKFINHSYRNCILTFISAEIFSFNVPVSEDLRRKAEQANVVIKENNVIYTLIDQLNESANSRIPPFMEEDKKGRCQIFLSNGERIKMELKLIQIIHGTLFPTHPNLSIALFDF